MEAKNIDVSTPNTTLFVFNSNIGVITLLNGCQQGVTATTRLGRYIQLLSLTLRGVVTKAANQTGETVLRILLIRDSQANGAAPTAADIIQGDTIDGLYNLNYETRFEIIYDCMLPFGSVWATSLSIDDDIDIKFPTTFNAGSAGTVADISTNAVYMLTYCNSGLQIASPLGTIRSRIFFLDQ